MCFLLLVLEGNVLLTLVSIRPRPDAVRVQGDLRQVAIDVARHLFAHFIRLTVDDGAELTTHFLRPSFKFLWVNSLIKDVPIGPAEIGSQSSYIVFFLVLFVPLFV